MLKRSLIALVVVAVAAATGVANAQDQPGPFVDEAFGAVVHFLALDEAQTETFRTLLEDRAAAGTPIRESILEVDMAIREQLESTDPDPTTVGELVIERHALRVDLADVHATFVDGFEAILNEEQTTDLARLRDAKRLQRILPAFERFGLLVPGDQDQPAP